MTREEVNQEAQYFDSVMTVSLPRVKVRESIEKLMLGIIKAEEGK